MKILGINFADGNFRAAQKRNTRSMKWFGKIRDVIEFSPSDIDADFREKHGNILSVKRGAGLWLWKPYFVLRALRTLDEGDFLFYCDAGAVVVRDIQHLVEDLKNSGQDMMFFALPLLNRQFCKRETFKAMNIDESFAEKNQIMATQFLLRKTAETEAFIEEWLAACCDERAISPDHFCPEVEEFSDFVAHREDQSVLSLLLAKRGYVPFKDPSQYRVFPWEYGRDGYFFRTPKTCGGRAPVCIVSIRSTAFPRRILVLLVKLLLRKLKIYDADFFWKRMGKPTILPAES